MDFARKQLERFGWKEGKGLGKDNQGMLQAIKPTLKTGKEGMGYDFSKELTDTWWTRAYDDSLNRINVETDKESSETLDVKLKDDDDEDGRNCANASEERPFEKMRKRMMKATFTTFSKGATLSNGEMIKEEKAKDSDSDDSEEDTKKKSKKDLKSLTDEELLKACGGRTAHKAARFGLKLNGKLARIAAQEEAAKALLSPDSLREAPKSNDIKIPFAKPAKMSKEKKKKSKEDMDAVEEVESKTNSNSASVPEVEITSVAPEKDSIGKKKKHKKRKYAELEEASINAASDDETSTQDAESSCERKHKKKKQKKSKKQKCSSDADEEAHALLADF